jgi:hypothetical protein
MHMHLLRKIVMAALPAALLLLPGCGEPARKEVGELLKDELSKPERADAVRALRSAAERKEEDRKKMAEIVSKAFEATGDFAKDREKDISVATARAVDACLDQPLVEPAADDSSRIASFAQCVQHELGR